MFEGVLTALVTPFRGGARSEIDETALTELVEKQIAAGVDGLVPCGTTGEAPTLSHAEHVRVVELTVKAARKRVPVIAGASSNSTAHAIELSRACKTAGADGLLHVTPYYNKPTQDGLYQHFKAIAEAAGLPIVLYNVPGRTSVDLLPETVGRLATVPGIVAIKEATGLIPRAQHILARAPKLTVLSGDDATTFALYAVGARGVISVLSNVAPREMSELWDLSAAGRWAEAAALNAKLQPLCDALFVESNPIPVKAGLAMMKQCAPEWRLPLTPPSEPTSAKLRVALTEARVFWMSKDSDVPIIVSGAAGRMGRMVLSAIASTTGVRLEGALERRGSSEIGRDAGEVAGVGRLHVAIADDLGRVLAGADRGAVLIDFSAPAVSAAAAAACAKRGVGVVVGTTGLSKEQQAQITSAASKVPVLQTANFSLGVNVLLGLCARAAEMLEDFDLEVVEIHHGKKRDAPSGTALRIAEALAEGRGVSLDDVGVYERKGDVGPRSKGEIGVMALRGGDVVGEHTAYFFGAGERVELTHRATSRETFARGAVRAARWLSGKPAGRYDMQDVLGLRPTRRT